MRLIPKINFIACLYAHIEDLAAYHKWSSKKYPEVFFESLSPQTAKNHIIWYKKFRQKHFIDWSYEDAFIHSRLENSLSRLEHLKKPEREKLNEIFTYFKDDYRGIWNENKGKLRQIKKDIPLWWKKENKKFMEKALFITPNLPKRVSVFLFWNPIEFKATPLGKSCILIETNSRFPRNYLLQTIPHELGHLIDISYGPDSLSFFNSKFGQKKGMIMHEAVIRTLFPAPKPTSKITNMKNQTDRKIEELSSKLKPFLRSSISGGETYRDFLLRSVLCMEGKTNCPRHAPTYRSSYSR